jgi:hypothetical protein
MRQRRRQAAEKAVVEAAGCVAAEAEAAVVEE